MSGFNVVWDSMYDGSLCGKWPGAAVWSSVFMVLKDRHGNVDLSFDAIARRTGWPLPLLKQGIEQLLQPDPESRTPDNDGRRIVLIDPRRPWGWHVLNHELYRRKASRSVYDQARTESGADAERKRAARKSSTGKSKKASRRVPMRPNESRPQESRDKSHKKPSVSPFEKPEEVSPETWERLNVQAFGEWIEKRKERKKPLHPSSWPAAITKLVALGDKTVQGQACLDSTAAGWAGFFPPKTPVAPVARGPEKPQQTPEERAKSEAAYKKLMEQADQQHEGRRREYAAGPQPLKKILGK